MCEHVLGLPVCTGWPLMCTLARACCFRRLHPPAVPAARPQGHLRAAQRDSAAQPVADAAHEHSVWAEQPAHRQLVRGRRLCLLRAARGAWPREAMPQRAMGGCVQVKRTSLPCRRLPCCLSTPALAQLPHCSDALQGAPGRHGRRCTGGPAVGTPLARRTPAGQARRLAGGRGSAPLVPQPGTAGALNCRSLVHG